MGVGLILVGMASLVVIMLYISSFNGQDGDKGKLRKIDTPLEASVDDSENEHLLLENLQGLIESLEKAKALRKQLDKTKEYMKKSLVEVGMQLAVVVNTIDLIINTYDLMINAYDYLIRYITLSMAQEKVTQKLEQMPSRLEMFEPDGEEKSLGVSVVNRDRSMKVAMTRYDNHIIAQILSYVDRCNTVIVQAQNKAKSELDRLIVRIAPNMVQEETKEEFMQLAPQLGAVEQSDREAPSADDCDYWFMKYQPKDLFRYTTKSLEKRLEEHEAKKKELEEKLVADPKDLSRIKAYDRFIHQISSYLTRRSAVASEQLAKVVMAAKPPSRQVKDDDKKTGVHTLRDLRSRLG